MDKRVSRGRGLKTREHNHTHAVSAFHSLPLAHPCVSHCLLTGLSITVLFSGLYQNLFLSFHSLSSLFIFVYPFLSVLQDWLQFSFGLFLTGPFFFLITRTQTSLSPFKQLLNICLMTQKYAMLTRTYKTRLTSSQKHKQPHTLQHSLPKTAQTLTVKPTNTHNEHPYTHNNTHTQTINTLKLHSNTHPRESLVLFTTRKQTENPGEFHASKLGEVFEL